MILKQNECEDAVQQLTTLQTRFDSLSREAEASQVDLRESHERERQKENEVCTLTTQRKESNTHISRLKLEAERMAHEKLETRSKCERLQHEVDQLKLLKEELNMTCTTQAQAYQQEKEDLLTRQAATSQV